MNRESKSAAYPGATKPKGFNDELCCAPNHGTQEGMLKKILGSTIIMGTSAAMVMALDIVRVKFIAVFLGPEGVGFLSVLNHFHTLAATCITLGLGTGLVRYVARYNSEGDTASVQNVLSNTFKIVFPLSVAMMLVMSLLAPYLAGQILGDPKYAIFIIIYAISLPLGIYPTIVGPFLQGLKKIKSLAKIKILKSVISLFFIIPMLYFFRLFGAVLCILILTSVHLALTNYYLGQEKKYGAFVRLPYDRKLLGLLFQYGMTSLFVGMAFELSHLLFKIIIVNTLGQEANGIYQPVWALTMTYPTLILTSISAYSYPRLCELTSNYDIVEELNAILRVALLFIAPIMFFVLIARKPIIQLLYSADFLPATQYMAVQVFGDFFKIIFWAVGMYLLPTKRLLAFIVFSIGQDILLVALAFVLVGRFGLHGIAAAFAISYLLPLIGLYLYSKKSIGFKAWANNRMLVFSSACGLGTIIYSYERLDLWPKILLISLTASAWLLLNISRKEILQIKAYLSETLAGKLPFVGGK